MHLDQSSIIMVPHARTKCTSVPMSSILGLISMFHIIAINETMSTFSEHVPFIPILTRVRILLAKTLFTIYDVQV